jgi:hypothetical protein
MWPPQAASEPIEILVAAARGLRGDRGGEVSSPASRRHYERNEAIELLQGKGWIASSQALLAMTGKGFHRPLTVIASQRVARMRAR